jgi:DUF971 family protein
MEPLSDPSNRPTRIVREAEQRRVRVVWADGHECLFDWEYLRRGCPCASCHGEWGAPGYLDSNPTLTEQQTTLNGMSHVGRYAIGITWGDGHNTGIYTFRHLRELCPDAAG